MTHDELVLRAEKWLKNAGCKVVIRDPFRCINRENPDAIGWRDGLSILVECKISRADFLSDKKKPFRQFPPEGMGSWRFYMCPPNIINVEDLPEGWGLLWAKENIVQKIHGVPPNTQWYLSAPFKSNQQYEVNMLISALRRLEIRGHFPEIYEGVITGPPMDQSE